MFVIPFFVGLCFCCFSMSTFVSGCNPAFVVVFDGRAALFCFFGGGGAMSLSSVSSSSRARFCYFYCFRCFHLVCHRCTALEYPAGGNRVP